MFDFLKSDKVFNARHTDGTWTEVTAKSESQAASLAQQMKGKAVDKVQYVREVGQPASDFEQLHGK